jgi:hypothetical protein
MWKKEHGRGVGSFLIALLIGAIIVFVIVYAAGTCSGP